MFDFFLALFGGLYYGAKICNEKSKIRKADTRNQEIINTLNRDFDTWIHRVTNEKLEYEIQFTSDSAINAIHNRIINEAKIEAVTPDMIIMGLLAQHGKISKKLLRLYLFLILNRIIQYATLQNVIHFINSRPRKCLGYLSPLEFLSKKCCT